MFKQHSQTDCTGKVGFPYDTSLMFFWEFYSMNMPTLCLPRRCEHLSALVSVRMPQLSRGEVPFQLCIGACSVEAFVCQCLKKVTDTT